MLHSLLSRFQTKSKRRNTSHIKPRKRVKRTVIWKDYSQRKKRIMRAHISNFLSPLVNIPKISVIIGIFALIVITITFIIFWPFFKVHKILILREDNIININKSYSNVEYIRGESIFFLDTSELASRLQKWQQAIQNIKFELSFPDSLSIYLKSYSPIFQSSDYLILANGSLIKKEGKKQYDVQDMFLSQKLDEIQFLKDGLKPNELKSIQWLLHELPKNILWFSPLTVHYFVTEKEVLISNQLGTVFIFDLTWNIKNQVKQLAIFQKEWWNVSEKKYIYIDVRIPQKLFLCWYEEEFNCRNTIKSIYWDSVFKNLEQELSLSQQ